MVGLGHDPSGKAKCRAFQQGFACCSFAESRLFLQRFCPVTFHESLRANIHWLWWSTLESFALQISGCHRPNWANATNAFSCGLAEASRSGFLSNRALCPNFWHDFHEGMGRDDFFQVICLVGKV